jgi:hypothetical protein
MNEVKAPCGCPGEVIIGTFVRCLKGCDGGPVLMNARRTPGHADMCACRPCQIRRQVRTIVLRSKDGRDVATLAWNGSSTSVRGYSNTHEYVRHWKMLDTEGAVVASGMVEWYLTGGGYTISIDLLFEQGVKLSIQGADHDPITNLFSTTYNNLYYVKALEELEASMTSSVFDVLVSTTKIPYTNDGWPLLGREVFRQDIMGSVLMLERAALSVDGVAGVRVTAAPDFTVNVALRAYHGSLAFEGVQKDLIAVCRDVAPAGITIRVVDETPQGVLWSVVKTFRGMLGTGQMLLPELLRRLVAIGHKDVSVTGTLTAQGRICLRVTEADGAHYYCAVMDTL